MSHVPSDCFRPRIAEQHLRNTFDRWVYTFVEYRRLLLLLLLLFRQEATMEEDHKNVLKTRTEFIPLRNPIVAIFVLLYNSISVVIRQINPTV